MFLLAVLGLNTGPQSVSLPGSPEGRRAALFTTVMVAVCCVTQAFGAKFIGLSSTCATGGIMGFLGQSAVLQVANVRITDECIEAVYVTLFAFTIIVKILLLPLIISLS